jgi:hypothetical protein
LFLKQTARLAECFRRQRLITVTVHQLAQHFDSPAAAVDSVQAVHPVRRCLAGSAGLASAWMGRLLAPKVWRRSSFHGASLVFQNPVKIEKVFFI